MKKITNISLAGSAYSLEEDAYDVLRTYLQTLECHFSSHEDGAEILRDIESGVADKLLADVKTSKRVVTLAMVDQVIRDMGQAEDIILGESGSGEEQASAQQQTEASTKQQHDAPKKLFRDGEQALVGGVAAGIANYFSIDPTLVRLAFVLGAFLNGTGVIAYIVLWLIVPEAKTTSEKYQMRGESITVSTITERVQEGVARVRNTDLSTVAPVWHKTKEILNKLFTVLGTLIRFALQALRIIIGLALTLGSTVALAASTSLFVVLFIAAEPTMFDPVTRNVVDLYTSSTAGIVLLCAALIALILPLVVILQAGTSLLARRNRFTTNMVLVLGVSWIVALSIAASAFFVTFPELRAVIEHTQGTLEADGEGEVLLPS